MARITVVTAGHLSTCPRMVKAADAFAEAGHDVHVVSTRSVAWATEGDAALRATRHWAWTCLDHTTGTALGRRRGLRSRVATAVVDTVGAARAPWAAVVRAYAPLHPELVRAANAVPADLLYGGTTGALAAVAEAAGRLRVPYALDLEDLHTAESTEPDAAHQHALAARIEREVLPGAAFLTTSSDAIGEVYRDRYAVSVSTIHNVFPRPVSSPRVVGHDGPLRLYWVGQAIGPGRGIEDVIAAVGEAGIPAVLHLRGRVTPFAAGLVRHAAAGVPGLVIEVLPPVAPDTLLASCEGYDVGVAAELLPIENRRRCISNKLFTYLPAGLAVILTESPGHQPVIKDLGSAACTYAPGDIAALARGLRRWHEDRAALLTARHAAAEAAARRWHWEHEDERGRLLSLVAQVVG
ncbi:MAG: hypothetical protein Q8L86_07330 [Vicinamibacterales bacterium]|nr:hypothetical protein [Vicinamibacterales bacterium]